MQLDTISLRFKFLNPLGSSIIPVLLFTLGKSSLNKNRAVEHCAMKYISAQWVVSFHPVKRKMEVLHSSYNMDGDRGRFESSAKGLNHVSRIYVELWTGWEAVGTISRLFWGWLKDDSLDLVVHHCLQVKLFLCSQVYEQKIWVTFPARKGIQDSWRRRLGGCMGDTLVKVHRTHILLWQSFQGLALCHPGASHRVSCYSSLHMFMEALWTITMIWCGF